ncbi:MAG: hypothetical protein JWQ98_1973 [Chlorobi bacterium]|nr:hypothetical protein [Chlorobiota bacterium]
MNIHEQITALLDGELHDETQVAELLHVLAVAPEKRLLLMEQVKMGRSFGTLGAGLAPSRSADAAIWAGIGAVDAVTPVPPPTPVPPSPSLGFWQRPGFAALAGVLLIGLGTAVGYLVSGKTVPASAIAARKVDTVVISRQPGETRFAGESPEEITLLRDSLVDTRSRYATLASTNGRLLGEISRLKSRAGATPSLAALSAPHRADRSTPDAAATLPVATVPALSAPSVTMVLPRAFATRMPASVTTAPAPISRLSSGNTVNPMDALHTGDDRKGWMVGIRNNFRLSLPHIYGVPAQSNTLTDREIMGSFDGGLFGLRSPLRFGAAFGGTQFSQVLHTNTGGAALDTIIEQSPTFLYGRGFVSSQLISSEIFGTSVEFGGGGTSIGPFATLGVDAEFRVADGFSGDIGLSSWFLWSQFRGQTITSTNLNVHGGFALWF